MLDAAKPDTLQLAMDIEQRLRDRRETLLRFIGVAFGMAVVFATWCIPGYWKWYEHAPVHLPFMFDQWLSMAAFGLLFMFAVNRIAPYRRRFPYLDDDGKPT